jgi:cytochrome c-type biogenesis protein
MSFSDWVAQAIGGSMLLGLPLAALAGLVSFLSPCVLPLVPGYLSYATGLSGADLASGKGARHRVLLGTLGFVAGFTLVFVAGGSLAGSVGSVLSAWQRPLTIAAGALCILLGLVFADLLPFARGAWRLNVAPRVGLAASPLLGVVFGFGWVPCIGPALAVVYTLAMNEATALRGGVLALAYALGLGVPFVLIGLGFDRLTGTLGWVKRHHRGIQLAGGVVMIAVGVLLVTGLWEAAMGALRGWAGAYGVLL